MTGRGVVLAEQDATEVERRSVALMAELAPRSSLGAILIGQLAMLSVRMERAAKREEAGLAIRVAHSAEDFENRRVRRAEATFDEMLKAEDPRTLSRELRRSPEGIDRLLAAWADLRIELSYTAYIGWTSESLVRASMLIGMRPVDAILSRLGALSHAAQGSYHGLEPGEGAGLEDHDRRRWASDRLVEWVDEEVAKLEAIRESLNHEAIEVESGFLRGRHRVVRPVARGESGPSIRAGHVEGSSRRNDSPRPGAGAANRAGFRQVGDGSGSRPGGLGVGFVSGGGFAARPGPSVEDGPGGPRPVPAGHDGRKIRPGTRREGPDGRPGEFRGRLRVAYAEGWKVSGTRCASGWLGME